MSGLPVTYTKPLPIHGIWSVIQLADGLVRWETPESVTYFNSATHHIVDGELEAIPLPGPMGPPYM